jgi:hypothetical protein
MMPPYVSHEYDEDIKKINDGLHRAIDQAVARDVISYDRGDDFRRLLTVVEDEDITAYRERIVSAIDERVVAIAPCTDYLTRILQGGVIEVDRGIGIWLYHRYRELGTWDQRMLWGVRGGE